ncbi:MAG TPA: DUF1559 domain-containing protein, partial [Gemmataceae bacterium]
MSTLIRRAVLAIAGATLLPAAGWAAPAPAAGPPAPSQELVPADAAAFLHVRAADLYDSPFGKQLRAALAKDDPQFETAVEKETGLALGNIATFTYVFVRVDTPAPQLVFLMTTRVPYSKDKVLAANGAFGNQANAAGLEMHHIRGREVLIPLDDRTLAFTNLGPDEAAAVVNRMRQQVGRPPRPGALRPALDRSAGKAVAGGLNVRALPLLPAGFQPPPPFDTLLPLLKAESVSGSLDIGGPQATLELRADFPSATAATEGEKAVKGGLSLLTDLLARAAGAPPPPGPDGALVRQLLQDAQAAVGKATVSRDQGSVRAKVTTPALSARGPEVAAAVASAVRTVRESADRARASNNLKQIVLAMHNYNDAYQGKLPAHAIYAADVKTPLLSWRVAILPYLEEEALYKEFKLDEPWHSEHNKKLIPRMPKVYLSPTVLPPKEPGRTYYQVFVGGGAPWERSTKQP